MTDEQILIGRCINNDRKAQSKLYALFAPKMKNICLYYSKSDCDAEDIMQEGFIKVFRYLEDFKNNGSFEGWVRRIMVTTALNFYKRKRIVASESELSTLPEAVFSAQESIAPLLHEELMDMVSLLPNGYRKVFSLNTIHGFTHKEIGEMLNISINTSKSQLIRARHSLQKRLIHETERTNYILQTA
ncbi:MAG: RNA polymerase sigma factor [Lentimicrobiaceae bacterium]|jgi:RNA polymerase sigma-70 factor (ECF subfamily)|nr:RNA polymerase sigma factor [Lentimicrobiaceae bacterium]